MQQSMFVMFFFMLILMLMSGLFTPVSSMPEWAQVITYFNPLKYFMEGMRMVYLKGSSLLELLPEIGVLLLFALGFNTWAVIDRMRKITIVLLSSLLIIALGACKNATPQVENGKPALMWFDAEANFERFSNPDSIDYYLTKIKSLGFTHAIVDVRPITGEVLFDTEFAPKMREWHGYERKDFDYLGHFIKKAHELGIEVHASLNVFVAGHNYFDRGLVYSTHPEWASTVYTPEGITSITNEKKKYSAMVNPVNEEFQTHILNVLKDLVKRYPDLDGLMLDRVRYDGITADFSDLSRQKFEAYIGQKVEKFPEDIFEWKKDENDKYYPERGKHFLKWIEWRTKNIYDFMARARNEVKKVNPDISFGTYTGAWYPSYYEVGVNFASKKYDRSFYDIPAQPFCHVVCYVLKKNGNLHLLVCVHIEAHASFVEICIIRLFVDGIQKYVFCLVQFILCYIYFGKAGISIRFFRLLGNGLFKIGLRLFVCFLFLCTVTFIHDTFVRILIAHDSNRGGGNDKHSQDDKSFPALFPFQGFPPLHLPSALLFF